MVMHQAVRLRICVLQSEDVTTFYAVLSRHTCAVTANHVTSMQSKLPLHAAHSPYQIPRDYE